MTQMRLQATAFDAGIFAQFGDVICTRKAPDKMINQGKCARYHDLAQLEFIGAGSAGISLFDAEPRALPYQLEMMERHPLGSQAFLPLHEYPDRKSVV